MLVNAIAVPHKLLSFYGWGFIYNIDGDAGAVKICSEFLIFCMEGDADSMLDRQVAEHIICDLGALLCYLAKPGTSLSTMSACRRASRH